MLHSDFATSKKLIKMHHIMYCFVRDTKVIQKHVT